MHRKKRLEAKTSEGGSRNPSLRKKDGGGGGDADGKVEGKTLLLNKAQWDWKISAQALENSRNIQAAALLLMGHRDPKRNSKGRHDLGSGILVGRKRR